ncbi:hypothetical protein ACVXG7_29220 [Enterobacter hormaechei]
MDTDDAVTRGLRLTRGDRNLLPKQIIQQGGFANVRTSDDGNKSAMGFVMLIPAPAFLTPVRRQPVQPYDDLNPCRPPVHSGH